VYAWNREVPRHGRVSGLGGTPALRSGALVQARWSQFRYGL